MNNTSLPYLDLVRKQHALTQSELATMAALSLRTVKRAEKGLPVSVETSRALAAAFDLPSVEALKHAGTSLARTQVFTVRRFLSRVMRRTALFVGLLMLSLLVLAVLLGTAFFESIHADFMDLVTQADTVYAQALIDTAQQTGAQLVALLFVLLGTISVFTLVEHKQEGTHAR